MPAMTSREPASSSGPVTSLDLDDLAHSHRQDPALHALFAFLVAARALR